MCETSSLQFHWLECLLLLMRLRDNWGGYWKLRQKTTQSFPSYKASPAFKSALRMKIQGVNMRPSAPHAAQPLTYPRVGCKWLCVESFKGGGGGTGGCRLLDLPTAFFTDAGGGLSYSSCLTTCIPGLLVRLVPCHLSHCANTPWMKGGWDSKACLWGRGLYWHWNI